MKSFLAAALAELLLVSSARALFPQNVHLVPPPLSIKTLDIADDTVTEGSFDQLLDHSDPSAGTFKQRYWYSTEFYAGPGSPVVVFNPGESEAEDYTGYLTNRTLPGAIAQSNGAASILVEHRYWGGSSPYKELTVKNLQQLTLDNSIKDMTYFANNVKLPFDSNGTSTPKNAPWIFSGGSYSGALSAWIHAVDPGTFWAHHASSAVVEAVDDFWTYFEPVRKGMPQNCSTDVTKVVEYVDRILLKGSDEDKFAIKKKFGLETVEFDDDFASGLQSGPSNWQGKQFTSGYSSFDQFCDYVENQWPGSNHTAPGPEGVGLKRALEGYSKWTKEIMLPGTCESYGYYEGKFNTECFDTHNETSAPYRDIAVDNFALRQWNWFLCNEPFKWWQTSAPKHKQTLVSRLVDPEFFEKTCAYYFPPEGEYTFGIDEGLTVHDVNAYTGGWNYVDTKRLIWVNGEFDPWQPATVSSKFRPGGPLQSTDAAPVHVIPGGIHCSDLSLANANANEGVREVFDAVVETMEGWVAEFYEEKGEDAAEAEGLKL